MEDLPVNEAAKIVANKIQMEKPHDRGWYRINATRGITGGRKLVPRVLNTFSDVSARLWATLVVLFCFRSSIASS